MGISFNFKEALAAIINSVASAFIVTQGGTPEQAALIGSVLEGSINGFHFERSSTAKMKQAIQYALSSALDNFDIVDSCSRALQDELISEQNIKGYLASNNQFELLKEKICSICRQFDECDIDTLPVDELAESIIQNLKKTILEDHELANLYNLLIGQQTLTQIEEIRLLLLKTIEKPPETSFQSRTNHNTKVEIHTANADYLKNYTEPLFLHKNRELEEQMTLQDIFIESEYSLGYYSEFSNAEDNLIDYLNNFNNSSDNHVLFIEGDAGVGKSGLISHLVYLNSEQELFSDRKIICIRLRDIAPEKNLPTSR